MPWEKSFDETQAVDKAINVFWQKGYEATSIANLVDSIGINKGSLYNAFKGKRQLFLLALAQYDNAGRRDMLTDLENLDNPVLAFRTLFDTLVTQAVKNDKGCFFVNTFIEFDSHGPEVKALLKKSVSEFEAFFQRGIEVAQARGELAKEIDPDSTAKGLYSMVVAIRVLGRGVSDESSLRMVAAQALSLVRL